MKSYQKLSLLIIIIIIIIIIIFLHILDIKWEQM